jgi:hypothetical protein
MSSVFQSSRKRAKVYEIRSQDIYNQTLDSGVDTSHSSHRSSEGSVNSNQPLHSVGELNITIISYIPTKEQIVTPRDGRNVFFEENKKCTRAQGARGERHT